MHCFTTELTALFVWRFPGIDNPDVYFMDKAIWFNY